MANPLALIPRESQDGEEIALPVALRSSNLQLAMFDTVGPGRLLHQAYSAAGRRVEKAIGQAAHKLGLGPGPTSCDIENALGTNSATRQSMLDTIYDSFRNNTTTYDEYAVLCSLKNNCKNLLEYALPSETPTTRIQAFRNIIALTTRYPGLRRIFLESPAIKNLADSPNAICRLWKISEYKPETEARFTLEFAAHCLAKCDINVYLEGIRPTKLGCAFEEGMGVVDTMLVRYCDGVSGFPRLIAVRYLAGILELPTFWSGNYRVQRDTMDKLCKQTLRLIEDINPDSVSVNDLAKFALLDPDGVDALAEAILVGGEKWVQRKPRIQDYWLNNFTKLFKMLRGLILPNLLPNAYADNWEVYLKGTIDQLAISNLDYHFEDVYEFVNRPLDLQSAIPVRSNWRPSDFAEEPLVNTKGSSLLKTITSTIRRTILGRTTSDLEEGIKPAVSLTGEDLPSNPLEPGHAAEAKATMDKPVINVDDPGDKTHILPYAQSHGGIGGASGGAPSTSQPSPARRRSDSIKSITSFFTSNNGNSSRSGSPPPLTPSQRDSWVSKPAKYICQVVHPCQPAAGVSYYSYPFFTLLMGDFYDVLQEAGDPNIHPNFPLYIDDGEECLLLCRDGEGVVGWALASFLEPVTSISP